MQRKIVFLGLLVMLVAALPLIACLVAEAAGLNSRDVAAVRALTAQYLRIEAAERDGFVPLLDCISDLTQGTTDVHYVRPGSLQDDRLEMATPEVLVYELKADGKTRLAAVEYVVPAALWTGTRPPEFLGQKLEYGTSIGSRESDPHYKITVWAWRRNPNGLFEPHPPAVTCRSDGRTIVNR
jgi:hypothetical protein